jgi:hypothetical protein
VTVSRETYEELVQEILFARQMAEPELLRTLDGFLERLVARRRRAAEEADEPERAETLREIVRLAEKLRDRILDRGPPDPVHPDALASRLENARALVVLLPGAPDDALAALEAEGFRIAATPWGPAADLGDPRRRGMAARLLATIRDLDAPAPGMP